MILAACLVAYFMLFFNSHFNSLYFAYFKYKAMQDWKSSNIQQYVIPLGNKLKVVNTETKDRYNRIARRKGIKELTILDLNKMAYFKSPEGNFVEKNKKVKVKKS